MVIKRCTYFLCLMLLSLMGCSDGIENWPRRNFDEATWAATAEKDRFVFVQDLMERRKLINAAKPEVIRMLGKPSYDDATGEYITYIVKADGGNLFILDIRFNRQKSPPVVEKVFVRSD